MITSYDNFITEKKKSKYSDTDPEFYGIEKYEWLPNGELIVLGSLYLNKNFFMKNPFVINTVKGNFSCNSAKLISLDGCPKIVTHDFDCKDNELKNLKGGPIKVGRNYMCSENRITSLEGCCEEIGEDFYCRHNNLESLVHGPKKVGRHYYCYGNDMTSLEGAPEIINGEFLCHTNKLSDLKGSPTEIFGNFNCTYNPSLTDLSDGPKIVSGTYKCREISNSSIENYPLALIGISIDSDNENYKRIRKLVYDNQDMFMPLLDDKVAFHKQVMRMLPDLIKYYTTISQPSKKTII